MISRVPSKCLRVNGTERSRSQQRGQFEFRLWRHAKRRYTAMIGLIHSPSACTYVKERRSHDIEAGSRSKPVRPCGDQARRGFDDQAGSALLHGLPLTIRTVSALKLGLCWMTPHCDVTTRRKRDGEGPSISGWRITLKGGRSPKLGKCDPATQTQLLFAAFRTNSFSIDAI